MSPSSSAPPTWQLSPLHLADLQSPIPVPEDGLTLGRDPASDVLLSAAHYPGVSARHARVELDGDALRLVDLGSKNGTLVAGKRVEDRELHQGDVVELGPGGPRFLVLSSRRMQETVAMPLPRLSASGEPFSRRALDQMKRELGITHEGGVAQMLHRRSRRELWLLVVFAIVLAGAGTVVTNDIQERGEAAYATLTARADELALEVEDRLSEARRQVELVTRAWEERNAELDRARASWDEQRAKLEAEREGLLAAIARVEDDERGRYEQLERLRARLESTTASLERFDPVNLEQARLREVSRVEKAVVMIEARQRFREEASGRMLHFEELAEGGVRANFEGRGAPLEVEATGSGFCVGGDGWILTNAHVVLKKSGGDELDLGAGLTLVPEMDLEVVFSGDAARHPATIVRWASGEAEDLALLKIEPFEGMPHLDDLDPDLGPPMRGEEVYLLGFPLGKRVLGQGDAVTASTFRGIVSRVLPDFIQVDAAVHPGASGGPLIDGSGRVRGIVVGMQAVGDESSSAIGYIIPIAQVRRIWPPAGEADGPIAETALRAGD